jgi:Transposase, Mutator family
MDNTDPMELLRKAETGDADCLRDGIRLLAQQLMEAEVSQLTGAERGERSPDRVAYRNGYRPRHGIPARARSSWPSRGCARQLPARHWRRRCGQQAGSRTKRDDSMRSMNRGERRNDSDNHARSTVVSPRHGRSAAGAELGVV